MTYKFVTREEIEQQEKEHDENSIAGEHCCNGQYKMLLRLLAERDAYRARLARHIQDELIVTTNDEQ